MTNPQPFDPNEFLILAARLSQATAQAELRSAVSRAYYAAFLHAREVLGASGEVVPTGTGRDHGLVLRALRARGGGTANLLGRLRAQRGYVDYDLAVPIGQIETQRLVRIAQRVYDRL